MGRNGHQIKEEENCEGLMNRKLGENKNLLLSWMDVEQSKAKKVLKYYGLWNSDSKFTNNKRKSWKSGNWSCSRQFSGKDRFAITCDYYR
ncbi:hypothetical protein [Mycoplasma suis]|uniref:Uncharacterized protein n=1 Tax=Mycoplasma suis (strain Illinois) TaxID=768700 RepID=F0QQM0_MYCSL|nr:hypothetical protein [Mycoplasma suis]ADX97790.1 hypothetical protein MSU_0246 [Mycoplasma suis str. Illinois]